MPRFFLILALAVLGIGMISVAFPDGADAIIVVLVLSLSALSIFRHFSDDKETVTKIFLIALITRLLVGMLIEIFDLRSYLGADALTYDKRGTIILDEWFGGSNEPAHEIEYAVTMGGSGWGMNYLVAILYAILGRNLFAAQSFCAVFGAATAPMVYFCSLKIFNNRRSAQFAAYIVALFPALVIWSSQMLKDGLIVFLLVLAMTMVIRLQDQLDYGAVLVLTAALLGIITLRFYIFYMVAVAIVGSFLIGVSNSPQSIARRTAALVLLGIGLTYFGVAGSAGSDLERYANLERIEATRSALATGVESGYGEDLDVSTTQGALSALPIGLAYLLLAPFPWQVSNFRQAMPLPEMVVWWGMIPLLAMGIIYAIRYRLRKAFPVLIFSLLLTLVYALFQGNVGTAYRQRTQIQVFLFIFIAVGWEIWKERREDKKNERLLKQRKFDERIRIGLG